MKPLPLVTALMPVRNGEPYIGESIQSLLNQSLTDWELLVIDDSSEDDSVKKVLSFRDPRIRVLQTPGPIGIPRALNLGIQEAQGTFIARLDSDDLAHPNRLKLQTQFLFLNPGFGLVGSHIRTFGELNRTVRYPVTDDEIRMSLNFGTAFAHPAVMYRTNWDSGVKGFYKEIPKAEDFELWVRISQQWRCHNIPRVLTYYRTHANQVTKKNVDDNLSEMNRILENQHAAMGLPFLSFEAGLGTAREWWGSAADLFSERYGFHKSLIRRQRRRDYTRRVKYLIRHILRLGS